MDFNILDNLWFIKKKECDSAMAKMESILEKVVSTDEKTVIATLKKEYAFDKFNDKEAQDFAERYFDFGEYQYFGEEKRFVTYTNQSLIRVCTACGNTEEINEDEAEDGEWFCDELCRETNNACIELKNKPYDEFISDAATTGFVIMEAAKMWDLNHRSFVGSKPYGYIAETHNDMVDSSLGKKVKPYFGSDNAPKGADRVVNGQQIQTKYCQVLEKGSEVLFRGQIAPTVILTIVVNLYL